MGFRSSCRLRSGCNCSDDEFETPKDFRKSKWRLRRSYAVAHLARCQRIKMPKLRGGRRKPGEMEALIRAEMKNSKLQECARIAPLAELHVVLDKLQESEKRALPEPSLDQVEQEFTTIDSFSMDRLIPLDDCPSETLQVSILGLAGEICSFKINRHKKLLDVKTRIKDLTGIPILEQRVFASTVELKDDHDYRQLASFQLSKDKLMELQLFRRDVRQAQWLQIVSTGEKWTEPGRRCAGVCSVSLEYAPMAIRSDREVVLAAIRQNWEEFKFASEELRADREIALLALGLQGADVGDDVFWGGDVFDFMSEELQRDHEVVLTACEHAYYPSCRFLRALDVLGKDKKFALKALKSHGFNCHYISKCCLQDPEVLVWTIRQHNYEDSADCQCPKCGATGLPHEITGDLILKAILHDKDALLKHACRAGHKVLDVLQRCVNKFDQGVWSDRKLVLFADALAREISTQDLQPLTMTGKDCIEASRVRNSRHDRARRAYIATRGKAVKKLNVRGGRHKVDELQSVKQDL